ncbi:MAG: PAS domain S-box protein [Dehalococcoidia bacterium]|jgi:PAS domain S-box-containing protein|nr:PAS domain S-box protein [Dehalococcoidia bacterium]
MVSRFSDATYEAIIANAPDGILLVDRQGIIAFVNERACELFGYKRAELVEQPIEMLVPANRRGSHVAQREAFQQQPRLRPMGVGQHLTGLRKDGTEFPVEVSLASTGESDAELVIGVVRDVTEYREIEEERRDLITTVQRQLERDRIARDLHDDIIQSVYAVGLSLQIALNDDSILREDLVRRTVIDLNSVISDIRAYMRELTSDQVDGHPAGMLAARIEELVSGIGAPHWTVNVSLAQTMTRALEQQVHHLAKELISNVQRHSQAANASITLLHNDDQIELAVEDDGVGFEPNDIREGAFGLRSIHERVTELGGTVTIQPHSSHGTSVNISIPTPAPAPTERSRA